MSGCMAMARLAGRVQGVVVQMGSSSGVGRCMRRASASSTGKATPMVVVVRSEYSTSASARAVRAP